MIRNEIQKIQIIEIGIRGYKIALIKWSEIYNQKC